MTVRMIRSAMTALILLAASPVEAGGNTRIADFRTAKKHLAEVYGHGAQTFYCGCAFTGKQVDHRSCGYKPRRAFTRKGRPNKRAYRLEWEHIVPAHALGLSFRGWRQRRSIPECRKLGGRKCAAKIHREFRLMEADLYNLVPAIGEVNGNRSNKPPGMLPGEAREYGTCDVEISRGKIEPRPSIRGDVARIYLYMDQAYPGRGIISRKNRKLFEAWHRADPVSPEERQRATRIRRIQGNCNSFVLDCSGQVPPALPVQDAPAAASAHPVSPVP